MVNTIKLTGESLFTYLVKYMKLTPRQAMWQMVDKGQDIHWFECLDENIKTLIMNNDKDITYFIKNN